jgi:nucleoid DNA-binding protein
MVTKKKQADLSALDREQSEKVIQAFLAEVAEAAEAGLKIDLRPRGKKKPRRIAPAGAG